MKRFLIALLILALSTWIATKIIADPGYLLITRGQLALEMPLWLGLFGLIISFILVYFLIRCISYVCALPRRWYGWLDHRQQQKQMALNNQALFAKIYQKPKDWIGILKIIPQLERKIGLSKQQIQSLEQESYEGLLVEALTTNDFTVFESLWKDLPHTLKKDSLFINLYAQALIKHHQDTKAQELIVKQLKKQWFGPLVQSYSLINNMHITHQLDLAERWLKKHPDDPYLLLSLGRLCRQRKLWGKARDYLEASLVYDVSNSETYQELGKLAKALGETQQALEWFEKALALRSLFQVGLESSH